jgi:GPH family glycoside/pentoside/hexuronide:cation symporter
MIMAVGFTLVTTMMPYYVKYELGMESQTSVIMVLMLVTLGAFLVPCAKVCDRIGKARTYALGLSIAASALLLAFFLPAGSSPLIYIISVSAGLGFSAQWVCPHSMMPDVIEYDELLTGERREGIFYGVWSMSGKISGAFATALSGWVLDLCGYAENQPQNTATLMGIRVLFALLTAAFLLMELSRSEPRIPPPLRWGMNRRSFRPHNKTYFAGSIYYR